MMEHSRCGGAAAAAFEDTRASRAWLVPSPLPAALAALRARGAGPRTGGRHLSDELVDAIARFADPKALVRMREVAKVGAGRRRARAPVGGA